VAGFGKPAYRTIPRSDGLGGVAIEEGTIYRAPTDSCDRAPVSLTRTAENGSAT